MFWRQLGVSMRSTEASGQGKTSRIHRNRPGPDHCSNFAFFPTVLERRWIGFGAPIYFPWGMGGKSARMPYRLVANAFCSTGYGECKFSIERIGSADGQDMVFV